MSYTAKDQLAIKFRLTDGSDIGPKNFPSITSVAALKENIIAQWPKGYTSLDTKYDPVCIASEKENGPRTVKDIKLISGGRILENIRTVAGYSSPLCDISGGVTTMHVVVQPSPNEKGKELPSDSKQNNCVCIVL